MTDFRNDANLQGYWRLEADGSDETANGYDLTSASAPAYATGKFGNGADFEKDTPDYLEIAEASCPKLDVAGSQTWGCWIKLESSVPGGTDYWVMWKGTDNASNWGGLRLSEGTPYFAIFNGTFNAQIGSSVGALSTGTWYFLCGVYDATAQLHKIWVNATKNEQSKNASAGLDGKFALGIKTDTYTQSFDGIIDDAFFFDRALTDEEVGELYNGGTGLEIEATASASGPADLASKNGVAKADIKSMNGIAIADIKTINGVS